MVPTDLDVLRVLSVVKGSRSAFVAELVRRDLWAEPLMVATDAEVSSVLMRLVRAGFACAENEQSRECRWVLTSAGALRRRELEELEKAVRSVPARK